MPFSPGGSYWYTRRTYEGARTGLEVSQHACAATVIFQQSQTRFRPSRDLGHASVAIIICFVHSGWLGGTGEATGVDGSGGADAETFARFFTEYASALRYEGRVMDSKDQDKILVLWTRRQYRTRDLLVYRRRNTFHTTTADVYSWMRKSLGAHG